MHLVIVESASNQRFVYGTNRQRESIGASAIVASLATWAQEAMPHTSLDVVRTSGKIIILCAGGDSGADARTFSSALSLRALKDGAGVELVFATIEVVDSDLATLDAQAHLLFRAHVELARTAGSVPPAAGRWPQLPGLRVCGDSGLPVSPANALALNLRGSVLDQSDSLSYPSRVKRSWARQARESMVKSVSGLPEGGRLVPDLATLERLMGAGNANDDEVLAWVGVVHADVNQLGAVMAHLPEHFPDETVGHSPAGEALLELDPRLKILAFAADVSAAVERSTLEAHVAACAEVLGSAVRDDDSGPGFVPVVPILLAGDDVTVMVEHRSALIYAVAFLRAFERITSSDPVLRHVQVTNTGGLCAAAGVALVKRSYPFRRAYALAAELCENAKKADRSRSVLDFHALYDTATVGLARIRTELVSEDGRHSLTSRPLEVTADDSTDDWDRVVMAARAVAATTDEGERLLPRSALISLRDRLRDTDADGVEAIEEELRARGDHAAALLPSGSLLLDRGGAGRPSATILWDAIEAARFLPAALLAPVEIGSSAKEAQS